MSKRFFEFPNPVNETSARLVAAGVVAQAAVFLTVRGANRSDLDGSGVSQP